MKEQQNEMKFTGERLILGQVDQELELEHLNRYNFATQFTKNKRVLDAACGTGYGTEILSKEANIVKGIDIAEEAVEYAQKKYTNKNVEFQVASIDNIPFDENTFDTVVSFETIEHVDATLQQAFIKEIKRVLAKDGVLVISTPNREVYKARGENEFHVKELNYDEFKTILQEKFKNVYFFSQQFEVCNVIADEVNGFANVENEINVKKSEYFIAVCSDVELQNIFTRIIVRGDSKLGKLTQWAVENHERNENNNKIIAKIQNELTNTQNELTNTQNKLTNTQNKLTNTQNELTNTQNELVTKDIELHEKRELISDLNQEIINKQGWVEQLLEVEREFECFKASRSWRYLSYAWKVNDIIVPHWSRRRLIVKMTLKFVKHPLIFIKKVNLHRIKRFFYYLGRGRTEEASKKIDDCVSNPRIENAKLEVNIVDDCEKKCITDYDVLEFNKSKEPTVSIIIPVYNQFAYTYNCLQSIIKNSGDVEYEILIADDCSSDLTLELETVVKNVCVIRNNENLRFLKNCNNAAEKAKGKYILFLNNDTQVQENWLVSLIDLIESDRRIGLVGSKLVYSDGRLQEAGGIVWKDASAWNYGHGSNPNDPEYNYVKEADYISGASIMIRSELWEEIGGFDENFAPAYYEDTDLAFEVRKKGYKVIYQPASVVVHFEGISNGTNTSEGQKAYQVINQKKFYEKWRYELENNHFENGQDVFIARDRSRRKKTVLVVDQYIPTFDKDAGSRVIYCYLKLLTDLEYNVKFIGNNFYHDIKYAHVFEQMGIEILSGTFYSRNWKKWMIDNAKDIDYVLLCRPHIAIKYMEVIKTYTNAKIVYYGVDLVYLREQREYELKGEKDLLISYQKLKELEFYLMENSDINLTLSAYEKELMDNEFGEKKNIITPIFFFEKFDFTPDNPKEKKDLIFVGNFNHNPNEDGILWFINEIWDKVIKSFPECKLRIVGSNPTESIKRMASNSIIVTGFVSDEELEKHYKESRVCIIPLRYGAGVKGKTLEAMYNKMAIVSTSTGTEGYPNIEKCLKPFDSSDSFAQELIRLYESDEIIIEAANKNLKYVEEYFSYNAAIELFKRIFTN